MKIAIDAMGGDHAPGVVIDGVLEAARQAPEHTYILAGPRDVVQTELDRRGGGWPGIQIEHASQVIEMDEPPVEALKAKRDNSIMKCVKLLQEGKADGVMSAGNTGALAVAAFFKLGLIEGVKRLGIVAAFPTERGHAALIDVGANVNCRPINLLQYGIMASVYLKLLHGLTEEPTVGLVNIGEESEKGNELVKHSFKIFRQYFGPRFVGNIEGQDILRGKAQVIVCDGFVGNVILKTGEGMVGFMVKRLLQNGMPEEARRHINEFAAEMDYSEIGGAPLLGVKGVVVKAHGRSQSRAIARAVQATVRLAEQNLIDRIAHEIRSVSLWKRLQMWFGKDE